MGSTIIFHWFAQALSVMRAVQSLLDPHDQDHLLHARAWRRWRTFHGLKNEAAALDHFTTGITQITQHKSSN